MTRFYGLDLEYPIAQIRRAERHDIRPTQPGVEKQIKRKPLFRADRPSRLKFFDLGFGPRLPTAFLALEQWDFGGRVDLHQINIPGPLEHGSQGLHIAVSRFGPVCPLVPSSAHHGPRDSLYGVCAGLPALIVFPLCDPVQTVARIQQSAEQAGDKIPGDVLFAAGKEILEDLADLATKAGIHDFASDEDALDGAFFQAVDDYRMLLQESGKLNPQDYAGEMQKLQEMDASGDFERTLRSAAEQQAGGRQKPSSPFPQAGSAQR